MKKNPYVLSALSALGILSIFLPWVSTEFLGMKMSFNGMSADIDRPGAFILFLFIAILALSLSLIFLRGNGMKRSFGIIGISVIIFIYSIYVLIKGTGEMGQYGVSLGIGVYLMFIVSLLIPIYTLYLGRYHGKAKIGNFELDSDKIKQATNEKIGAVTSFVSKDDKTETTTKTNEAYGVADNDGGDGLKDLARKGLESAVAFGREAKKVAQEAGANIKQEVERINDDLDKKEEKRTSEDEVSDPLGDLAQAAVSVGKKAKEAVMDAGEGLKNEVDRINEKLDREEKERQYGVDTNTEEEEYVSEDEKLRARDAKHGVTGRVIDEVPKSDEEYAKDREEKREIEHGVYERVIDVPEDEDPRI